MAVIASGDKLEKKRGRQIANAGTFRRLREAQFRYLNCPSAKARAADEAMHMVAERRRRKRHHGAPYRIPRAWAQVTRDEILAALDLRATCDEAVSFFRVPKGPGCDTRLIVAFGPRNHARQRLVMNCLRHRGQLHPDHYGVPGRDRHAAIRRVVTNFHEGFTHVVHLDIVQAYPSFSVPALLRWAALPKEAASVFDPGCLTIAIPGEGEGSCSFSSLSDGDFGPGPDSPEGRADDALLDVHGADWSEARSGLSQGSSASAAACELVLADTLRAAGQMASVRFVALGDDVLVQARSQEEARAASLSLREHLASHPVGPFHVQTFFGGTPPDPLCRFLGYTMHVEGGALVPVMGERAAGKLRSARQHAYSIIMAKHLPPANRRAHVERVAELHRATTAQFPAWAGGQAFLAEKIGRLRARAVRAGLVVR